MLSRATKIQCNKMYTHMTYGNPKIRSQYKMNEGGWWKLTDIRHDDEAEKDLGVLFDRKLSLRQHIRSIEAAYHILIDTVGTTQITKMTARGLLHRGKLTVHLVLGPFDWQGKTAPGKIAILKICAHFKSESKYIVFRTRRHDARVHDYSFRQCERIKAALAHMNLSTFRFDSRWLTQSTDRVISADNPSAGSVTDGPACVNFRTFVVSTLFSSTNGDPEQWTIYLSCDYKSSIWGNHDHPISYFREKSKKLWIGTPRHPEYVSDQNIRWPKPTHLPTHRPTMTKKTCESLPFRWNYRLSGLLTPWYGSHRSSHSSPCGESRPNAPSTSMSHPWIKTLRWKCGISWSRHLPTSRSPHWRRNCCCALQCRNKDVCRRYSLPWSLGIVCQANYSERCSGYWGNLYNRSIKLWSVNYSCKGFHRRLEWFLRPQALTFHWTRRLRWQTRWWKCRQPFTRFMPSNKANVAASARSDNLTNTKIENLNKA